MFAHRGSFRELATQHKIRMRLFIVRVLRSTRGGVVARIVSQFRELPKSPPRPLSGVDVVEERAWLVWRVEEDR